MLVCTSCSGKSQLFPISSHLLSRPGGSSFLLRAPRACATRPPARTLGRPCESSELEDFEIQQILSPARPKAAALHGGSAPGCELHGRTSRRWLSGKAGLVHVAVFHASDTEHLGRVWLSVFDFTSRVKHGEFFPSQVGGPILAICGLGGFLRLLVGKDGTQAAHGL